MLGRAIPMTPEMPFIDPNVEHVGVARLRRLDGKSLRKKIDKKALVIREHDDPIAVLLSYEQYLSIQNQMKAVMETFEILSTSEEVQMLLAGLQDPGAGRSRSIEEIRKALKQEQ
jgi:PHD/YefM family antitoxin component YafN of YafNO toxin-antitoxin module